MLDKDKKYEKNYGAHFQRIPFLCFKKLLDRNGTDLNKKSILVASCGWGLDLYYLEKIYSFSQVFISDIELERVARTISVFDYAKGVVSDNHKLSFKDNSIDYVFVSTSLHHLEEPLRGLYELLRVARCGLIVIEPNDTWLTRLFEKLGWAREYEIVHGNYVYRFDKRDVAKISKALFFKYTVTRFFSIHKIAKRRFEFIVLKVLNNLANLFYPSLGNYILFLIQKDKEIPKGMEKEGDL